MKSLIIFLIFFGVWFALQRYILPKLGISTWMRPACQDDKPKDPDPPDRVAWIDWMDYP